jgi:2,3-bisphosphoglycerate-dependent phosphoglycerate mutase
VIYLVRHGQSQWNLARRTQGQIAHPRLTGFGRAQAAAAAAAVLADLAGRPLRAVVSSDLARARETAAVLAEAAGLPVRIDERLRERSLGRYEGQSYEESFAAVSGADLSDPDLRIGGGESLRQVAGRMAAALTDLAGDENRVTAAVSHGDAIRAWLGVFAGQPSGAGSWISVPHGAVAVLSRPPTIRWLTQA